MPADSSKFQTLDGMRGVAAVCVVILHCHHYFPSLPSGYLAVDLFFCLSGFVLSHAYDSRFASGLTAWQFFKIRAARLYPLFLVGIFLGAIEAMAAILLKVNADWWSWQMLFVCLPFNALMLPVPFPNSFGNALYPINGISWTIFFEIVANVAWAATWRYSRSIAVLISCVVGFGIGLISLTLYWGSIDIGANWNGFLGGIFRVGYSFFVGVLLYRIRHGFPDVRIHPALLLTLLPAILAFQMSLFLQASVVIMVFPMLVLLGSQNEATGRLASGCSVLGKSSYAMYIMHKRLYAMSAGLLIKVIGIDPGPCSPWIGIAFLAGLILICFFSDRLFDQPARKWLLSKFLRQSSTAGGRSPKVA